MDVWGRIYRDHWEHSSHPHVVERDDGRVERFESAAHYFEAPRLEAEREALRRLPEPVLDVGAGAGSYALHLQNRGLAVTAVDSSALAIKIAGIRGCLDVRRMDLRDLDLPDAAFGSIIFMGNTFGVHQTPESLPGHLANLRRIAREGGVLLTATIDPLDTGDPEHLEYHRRNRARGRPPGLVSVRVSYLEAVTDWFDLWLTTRDEVESVAAAVGWDLAEEVPEGPWRIRRFVAT